MDENLTEHPILDEPPSYRPPEPQVWMVLVVQLLLFILCAIAFQTIAFVAGLDAAQTLTTDAEEAARWEARLELGLGHFFTFTIAGFLTVWLFYRSITGVRPDWRDYLWLRRLPRLDIAALAILLMAVSLPLVLFALNINQLVPLPEYLKLANEQTEALIKGLLIMNNTGELIANLAIIALLPAIGEEIVFRGVVQQQLMRRIANPWVAITVSAAVFSFIHFQFDGFLPRLLLGFLLGWLYWQTQNFWIPVLAHFFNNALQVIGQYLYGKEMSTVDLEQDIQVPWFAAAISVFMVWVTMRLIRQTMDGRRQTMDGGRQTVDGGR
ncbi:MAG TPA: type II CAAX endopeptidase family protein [Saprospiraceae bacterium]|nr:type II CAAX endopeptidase family protein [Saprospiraceae bacterium]